MIDLRGSIDTIEGHLADGSPRSLTYAALECRLAIERICYERGSRMITFRMMKSGDGSLRTSSRYWPKRSIPL